MNTQEKIVAQRKREYCARLRKLDAEYQTSVQSPLHHDNRCFIRHQPRFFVRESYGFGHNRGIRLNGTTASRELAYSTVTNYIRDLKAWASGSADHITDVNSAGWRLITAHHWINGFENIRVLHIQKSSAYNRLENS
jgi:hypothetical protein